MILITHNITDPYFNIASEEYFMKEFSEDIVYLWRNDRAVIVGKHQNTIEEINPQYVDEQDIKVVRRLTGGGAVYHDINNINYSVIRNNENGLFANYGFFTEPVCRYLEGLGINAELNGRNDITIEGLKFSGNAQTVHEGRIMHHGTLLFSSSAEFMEGALKPSRLKIESKGVKSVRSRVTDISSHLKHAMTTEEFMTGLHSFFAELPGCRTYSLTEKDKENIVKLVKAKYGRWEWNYGSSPKYSFENQKRYDFGIVDVRLDVKNGRIKYIRIFGDYFASGDVGELEKLLTGHPHTITAVTAALEGIDVGRYINGMTSEQLTEIICRE